MAVWRRRSPTQFDVSVAISVLTLVLFDLACGDSHGVYFPRLTRLRLFAHSSGMDDDAPTGRRFTDLLKRLAHVPKRELDEQERKYRKERARIKHQPVTPTATRRRKLA
jgi:hypothetical protein